MCNDRVLLDTSCKLRTTAPDSLCVNIDWNEQISLVPGCDTPSPRTYSQVIFCIRIGGCALHTDPLFDKVIQVSAWQNM